jgi:ABC-type oligopeptide transport system substrate-binding subunit
MAIDRDRICNVLLDGMPVAHGLTAPGVLGFRADYQGLPFDPLGARKELEAAGYPGGRGLPPLQFVYRTQAPDAQHVSEGVAASLRQNLGITVQLSTMDWGAFLDGANRGKFDMYFLSWYADYLDPQNFLSLLFMSDSPLNRDGYSNPQFDKLCQAGDTTVDEAARIRDYQQAEDALIQDAGRIPLYYQRDANLVSPRVHGLRENLFGSLPDSKVWLDGKPK